MYSGHLVPPLASYLHIADPISPSASLLCSNWTGHYCRWLAAFIFLGENMASRRHAGGDVCPRQWTPLQSGLSVSESMVCAEEEPHAGNHVGCEKRHWSGTALRGECMLEPVWLEYDTEGLDCYDGMIFPAVEASPENRVDPSLLRALLTSDSS